MFRPSFVSGLAIALFAGCATDPGAPVEITEEFVFGLSADEVLAAKHVAQRPMSDAAWLDAHRGAFDCDRYGDLCAKIGAAAAEHAIGLGYQLAIEGADRDAVVRAQTDEIHTARVVWREIEPTVYNSNTAINSANGKRIKATVWAVELWPSLDLEADGECRTQKQILGVWGTYNVGSICGQMTATFTSTTGSSHQHFWSDCDYNDNVVEFVPLAESQASLRTEIDCDGTDGGWSLSESSSVSI